MVERRVVVYDFLDSIDREADEAPISEEVGRLLDECTEALAREPGQKKFTLQEIASRLKAKL